MNTIKNSLIEEMFLRVTNSDREIQNYFNYLERGNTGLATAYASKRVKQVLYTLLDTKGVI